MNLEKAVENLTLTTLYDGMAGGGGIQVYDQHVHAERMGDYDLNLADYWVTDKRWAMLTRQYLDKELVEEWLELICAKMPKPRSHGVAFLRSKTVAPRASGKRTTRQWGSCMIGWSFRRFPTPTITMHSRSTYVGYLAPLDVGVAFKLAEVVGQALGLDHREFAFNWYVEQVTFHQFRSMPWWFLKRFNTSLIDSDLSSVKRVAKGVHRFRAMDEAGRKYANHGFVSEAMKRVKFHQATGVDTTPFQGGGFRGPAPIQECWLSDLNIVYGKPVDDEKDW